MLDLQKFTIELLVLAALVVITLGLAIYRSFVDRDHDFRIHATADEASSVGKQAMMAQRVTWVERWGKALTVVTVVYFLVVLALILYNEWQRTSQVILTN